MGRAYSGVLAHVGFLTSLAYGCVRRGSVQDVLLHAWLSLLAFAAIGYVAGQLAGWIVDESVRGRLAAELDAKPRAEPASRDAQAA